MLVDVCVTAPSGPSEHVGMVGIRPNRLLGAMEQIEIRNPTPLNFGWNKIQIFSFQIFRPSYGPLLLVHEPSLKLSILSKFNQLWCQSTCQGCFHLPSSCLVRFLYP